MTNFGNNAIIEAARVVNDEDIAADGSYVYVGATIDFFYRGVILSSTLNQNVWITNDRTKDEILLPSSATFLGMGINFFQLGLNGKKGDRWSIKHDGVAPTAGKLAFTVVRE